MNTKLSAMIVASVMLVVAVSAAFAPSAETEGAVGDVSNPQYVIGTDSVAYVLTTGDVTAKLSMNAKAFDGPAFTLKAYYYATPNFTVNAAGVPTGSAVTTGFSYTMDDDTGRGTVTFTHSESLQSGYYLIEATLVDTIGEQFNKVTLKYYYAANISISTVTMAVVLVDEDDDEITDNLKFKLDTDFTNAFAKVKVGTGTSAEYLGADDYDFYESNLPEGIDMKSDGEIAGKIISTASVSNTPVAFKVYAINKNTGKSILNGSFNYTVADSENTDYFKYQIEGQDAALYSVAGYSAIKNDGSLTVTILNVDGSAVTGDAASAFSAVYSANGTTPSVATISTTATGSTVTLSGLGEYTGIVQLQITKTVTGGSYTAVIHVMLVGPLVHSGLEPTVTSA